MSDLGRAAAHYFVNGEPVVLSDPEPTARDLILAAGLRQPSEHLLLSIEAKRIRHCPHEDPLPAGLRRFRTFEGGQLLAFTLDEISQVWGAEKADVNELLEIFAVGDDYELVIEREGEPDLVLATDGEVEFGPRGVEDLVTRRKKPGKILVSVLTTNGVFPMEGVARVDPDTLVSAILARAARKLDLTDTATWIVTFENRDINPNASFAQNGLSGTVTLAWNAREGGGGA